MLTLPPANTRLKSAANASASAGSISRTPSAAMPMLVMPASKWTGVARHSHEPAARLALGASAAEATGGMRAPSGAISRNAWARQSAASLGPSARAKVAPATARGCANARRAR